EGAAQPLDNRPWVSSRLEAEGVVAVEAEHRPFRGHRRECSLWKPTCLHPGISTRTRRTGWTNVITGAIRRKCFPRFGIAGESEPIHLLRHRGAIALETSLGKAS